MSNLAAKTQVASLSFTSPHLNQLRDVINRLVATVEEENTILVQQRQTSLDSIIQRKSQLLLELMRAQKNCSIENIKASLGGEIAKFKSLMDANQRLLSVHLAAARDVSNTILDALRQNDSDGTYAVASAYGREYQ